MELDKIRELVKLVEESQIQELELGNRGETIRISKTGSGQVIAPSVVPTAPAASNTPGETSQTGSSSAEEASAGNLQELVSPMVGTFYSAPTPESDPFVKVGDVVRPGDVVCIVEAMKVMNEIEAEFGGTVRRVMVENAQPVEFGQALVLIEPA